MQQAIIDNSSSTYGSFSAFASNFQANGSAYVSTLTLNFGADELDTGSIAGSEHGGSSLTAEAVINESTANDNLDGQPLQNFTVIWLDTTSNSEMSIQIGANQSQQFKISINDMRSRALGITASMGISGFTGSNTVNDGVTSTVSEAALDVSTASNAALAVNKLQTQLKRYLQNVQSLVHIKTGWSIR